MEKSKVEKRVEPELLGQTVVVIGGTAGIGLETARRTHAEGARVILTGRDPGRLRHAASELDALSTAAFDAMDPAPLERLFGDLPTTIDHVMVTAGRPTYGRVLDMDLAQVGRAIAEHLVLAIQVARHAARKVRPGGTVIFMGATGGRRPGIGLAIASTVTAALPALTPNLALELAPVRVNLIAAGFKELGGEGVRETHSLREVPQRHPFRRLGAAASLLRGTSRDLPVAALSSKPSHRRHA